MPKTIEVPDDISLPLDEENRAYFLAVMESLRPKLNGQPLQIIIHVSAIIAAFAAMTLSTSRDTFAGADFKKFSDEEIIDYLTGIISSLSMEYHCQLLNLDGKAKLQ